MEPSNGFRSSPVSPSRGHDWNTPSPLPSDAIQHESLNDEDDLHQSYNHQRHEEGGPSSSNTGYTVPRHEVLSQASELDSPVYTPGDLDDRVHLTSQNTVWKRSAPYERDLERRRKSGRGNLSPNGQLDDSQQGGGGQRGALKAMSKSFKRASIRVESRLMVMVTVCSSRVL